MLLIVACVGLVYHSTKILACGQFFPIVEDMLFSKNSRGSPYCVKYITKIMKQKR